MNVQPEWVVAGGLVSSHQEALEVVVAEGTAMASSRQVAQAERVRVVVDNIPQVEPAVMAVLADLEESVAEAVVVRSPDMRSLGWILHGR